MKKILLGIGTFVTAAAPVATVVACGDKSPMQVIEDALAKPVEGRVEETKNININLDLDNIHSASGFDTWFSNGIKASTTATLAEMRRIGREITTIAQRMESSNPSPSEGAQAIVDIRQKMYDMVAKFHVVNSKVTLNYKGVDHIVHSTNRTAPSYLNYDVINSLHNRHDFELVMRKYQNYIAWLSESINPLSEKTGVKAMFASDVYKEWIKNNYTDAHKSLSGQYSLTQTMVSRHNSFFPQAPLEIKLEINPTPHQVDAFFAAINSAINSGMLQEEIMNTLI